MFDMLTKPGRKGFFIRMVAAFALGAQASAAMPPANIWILLIIGLSGLYYLLTLSTTKKSAFFTGWFFAFGYLTFSLSWIGNALLVDGNDYAWAWPLAVGGLPFIFAIYTGVATLAARYLSDLSKLSGFFSFVAWIMLAEWARGNFFTGFPWNIYGYTWAHILPLLQMLSFSNVYFLTMLTIMWCAAPGFLILNYKKKLQGYIVAALVIVSFASCFVFGVYRLNNTSLETRTDFQVRIVQPNIEQSEKWKQGKMFEHFLKHIKLSQPDDSTDTSLPTYIVWPETSLNYWIMQSPEALAEIRAVLALYKGPAYIISGILNFDPASQEYSNAIVMIDKTGLISNTYNKHHLVPFGEYIPFQKWIPLKPVAQFSGFTQGSGSMVMQTPEGFNYSPLVCYEIIFPDRALPSDFILNVTNDSWYGFSAGPYQHLAIATYRAIESGMPVIRSASTGISAFIDPLGKITNQTRLFDMQALTAELSRPVVTGSFKIVHKNIVLLLSVAILAILGLLRKSRVSD